MLSRRTLTLEVVLRKQHYVQACAQEAVLLYWGWYWPPVLRVRALHPRAIIVRVRVSTCCSDMAPPRHIHPRLSRRFPSSSASTCFSGSSRSGFICSSRWSGSDSPRKSSSDGTGTGGVCTFSILRRFRSPCFRSCCSRPAGATSRWARTSRQRNSIRRKCTSRCFSLGCRGNSSSA